MPGPDRSSSSGDGDYRGVIRWVFYALGFGLAVWLIYWLFRWLKNSKPMRSGQDDDRQEPLAIDLSDEGIRADDLPHDRIGLHHVVGGPALSGEGEKRQQCLIEVTFEDGLDLFSSSIFFLACL